ncbi:MAG: exonuclease domain-containing protein [Bacillota bacterium]|nr:exonuclease domain-containing protein [Bacillota bacterium]
MRLLEKELKDKRVLVFLDLEGTQISHEMIEIGAYKVYLKNDLSVRKIMPGFKSYVKAKHPVGRIVTELTGITDAQIKKEGKPFRVVQESFKKYVGKDWTKCRFVTFGNHDCHIIMQTVMNNLDCNDMDGKFMVSHCFDFARFIACFIRDENGNNYSLSNYLKLFGVPFEGVAHDALADAYNLVDLYKAFLANHKLVEQEYKKTVVLKNSHLPEPIRLVMKDLRDGKTVTAEQYDSYIKEYLS